jgi:hypothetical protein
MLPDPLLSHKPQAISLWTRPLCCVVAAGMMEARQQQVSLPHVSGEILELLLRFMYGGSCQVRKRRRGQPLVSWCPAALGG